MISTSFRRYIALGDSIISDDYPGPDLGAAALLFRNDDQLFPEFAGHDLTSCCPGLVNQNLSRTGHRIQDVWQDIARLERDSQPTVVLLSVGGNDLLQSIADQKPFPVAIAEIEQGLAKIVERLEQLFANLTLRVTNAYDPTDGTGRFASGRHLPDVPFALKALNDLFARVAGDGLLDIHSHFLGHGMRCRDENYHHYRADEPQSWFQMDIEPNRRGASEVRRVAWESLG